MFKWTRFVLKSGVSCFVLHVLIFLHAKKQILCFLPCTVILSPHIYVETNRKYILNSTSPSLSVTHSMEKIRHDAHCACSLRSGSHVGATLDSGWDFLTPYVFLKISVFIYCWGSSTVRDRRRKRQWKWWTPVSTCPGGIRRRISSWSRG